MRYKDLRAMVKRSKSRGNARFLLTVIGTYTNDQGTGACPSIRELAEGVGLAERTVQRLIFKLIDLGELAVEFRVGSGNTNVYSVTVPADPAGEAQENTDTQMSPFECAESVDKSVEIEVPEPQPEDQKVTIRPLNGDKIAPNGDKALSPKGLRDEGLINPLSSARAREADVENSEAAIRAYPKEASLKGKKAGVPVESFPIPEQFAPDAATQDFALFDKPLAPEWVALMLEEFRSFYGSKRGDPRYWHTDWQAAFRTWLLRKIEDGSAVLVAGQVAGPPAPRAHNGNGHGKGGNGRHRSREPAAPSSPPPLDPAKYRPGGKYGFLFRNRDGPQ